MVIAILALQGAFAEHQQLLQRIGAGSFLIRNIADWNYYLSSTSKGQRGLIIPGGESTAMIRILQDEALMQPLRQAILEGMPTFGTCAGMILLAQRVSNDTRERLATMDIEVKRNAYGRQLGSFFVEHEFQDIGLIPMTFIRAPYIENVGSEVEVLSTLDGHIVAARQGAQLVCSFHPELNSDTRVHAYFLSMIANR